MTDSTSRAALAPRLLAPPLAGLLALTAGIPSSPAAPPLLGNEIAASEPFLDSIVAYHGTPDVVAGQTGYFAAWFMQSNNLAEIAIRGARIRGVDGQLADLGSLSLSATQTAFAQTSQPVVAAGSTTYLAAWSTNNLSPSNPEPQSEIRAALVDQDEGASPAPLEIVVHASTQIDLGIGPLAAFHAATQRYLVLWREDYQLRGRWLGEDGAALDPAADPLLVSGPDSLVVGNTAAACGEDGCLAAWVDLRTGSPELYAARLDPGTGAAQDLPVLPIPQGLNLYGLDVIADGPRYLLAWGIGSTSSAVQALRLDSAGATLDPAGPVTLSTPGSVAGFPSLARTPSGLILAAWDEEGFYPFSTGVLVSTASSVQPVSPITTLHAGSLDSQDSAIACTGDGAPCALVTPVSGPGDSFGQSTVVSVRVPPDLAGPTSGDEVELSTRLMPQRFPAAACGRGADQHLVVWNEPGAYGSHVRGALFSPSAGAPLELDPATPLLLFGATEPNAAPAVASGKVFAADPDRFLVAYLESNAASGGDPRIVATLVDAGGPLASTFIGGNDIGVQSAPAVASDGARYLVAWNGSYAGEEGAILAARVNADGAVADGDGAGVVLALGAYPWHPPVVTHDGEGFLIVWKDDLNVSADVLGLRVAAAGSTLEVLAGPFPIVDTVYSPQLGSQSVASDGDGTSLVVWSDIDSIRATRVNRAGVRLDDGLTVTTANAYAASVLFDGGSYLVTWIESKEGRFRARGTWIGRDGTVTDPEGFDISGDDLSPNTFDRAGQGSLASSGDGRTLVTFTRTRFEDAVAYHDSERVRARFLGNPCAFSARPVQCEPSPCRTAGACDPSTLTCAGQVPEPDGTPCDGGLCFAGACVPDPPGPGPSSTGAGSPAPATPDDPAACGCRAAGAPAAPSPFLVALAALALRLGRRRRRAAPS